MFYDHIPWFSRDGNDIKTHGKIYTMVTYIRISSLHQVTNLAIGNRIYGIAITIILTSLNLDKYQYTILLSNDIDFFVS